MDPGMLKNVSTLGSINIFFGNCMAFCIIFLLPFGYLMKLSYFDSWDDSLKYDENKRKEAEKPTQLGRVISAKVERGSFLSTDTSTIETENGMYRVYGDIGSVEKGVPISKIQDNLYIGLPRKNRKFSLK